MTEKSNCPTTQEIFSDQIDKPMANRITGTAMDVITLDVQKPCKIKLQLVEIVQVFVVEGEEDFTNLYNYLEKNNYKNILVNKVDNTYTVTAQSSNQIVTAQSSNPPPGSPACPANAVSACSNSSYSGKNSCATSYLVPYCYYGGCQKTICTFERGYCKNVGAFCDGCTGCAK